MYFVDRKKITSNLQHIEELIVVFEEETNWTDSKVKQLALQRIGHNLMEAMMDVGNTMIDGFIMRDPGSYDDIIDILVDEKVITPEMDAPLKQVVSLRKMLVREFIAVDNDEVIRVLSENMDAIKQFPSKVQAYLLNELGPVSAFLPEDK